MKASFKSATLKSWKSVNLWSLLPIVDWLPRYNLTWLAGDLIAGLTVGMLVIPQALSYAKLAGLPLEYGLYTSFIGVSIYTFVSTSKDVTIGPTAVLSQLSGQLLATYNPSLGLDPVVFSTSVAILSGLLSLTVGVFRMGIIVDLISVPIVVGFTTGAALQIIFGQIAPLLGIAGIVSGDAPYLVLYRTLAQFNHIRLDAVFGLSAIAILVAFRVSTHFAVKKGLSWFIWIGHSANAVTLIFFTLISYFTYRNSASIPIKLIGKVPAGLTYLQVPQFSKLNLLWSPALAAFLVGVIEHIAMVKAFGRLNGYRGDHNQEIIALGVTNIIGPFFGAFPATGSLSRSSINSRSGVRTPLAGLFTSVIVLLSIYFITPAFYYIPSAVLSAIIIVAITDLLSRPTVIKQLWDIELFDFLSFLVAFVVTIFVSIEIAIYSSVIFSVGVLLYRIARPKLDVLIRAESGGWVSQSDLRSDKIGDQTPFRGIAVIRIQESLTYPNANNLADRIKSWIQKNTKFGGVVELGPELLWNENPSRKLVLEEEIWLGLHATRDFKLRAIVLDCSAVNHLDATGLQTLIDIRVDAEKHAGGPVLFYFAHAQPNTRSALQYFVRLSQSVDLIPFPENATNPSPDSTDKIAEVLEIDEFFYSTINEAVEAASYLLNSSSSSGTFSVHSLSIEVEHR